MTNPITISDFEKINGEQVSLANDSHQLKAKVIEVTGLSENHAAGRAPFSVLLLVDDQTVYQQQVFRLSHPSVSEFDLFVVPIGQRDGGVCYEAVFA